MCRLPFVCARVLFAFRRAKAMKSCKKHLGDDVEGDLLEDCVSDVCRGGEVFAVTAAAMMSDD